MNNLNPPHQITILLFGGNLFAQLKVLDIGRIDVGTNNFIRAKVDIQKYWFSI